MTEEEYRQFLGVLTRRYIQPKISRLRSRHQHHMMEEWSYHLDQATRAARVLRFIENDCDDDDDIYRTFTVERVARAVSDTDYNLHFSNRVIDEGGFLDAFEAHADDILTGLRPEHLPEADREFLRQTGSPDADADLAELVFLAHSLRRHITANEMHIADRLNRAEKLLDEAAKEFEELRKLEPAKIMESKKKKSRRWSKGLGKIGQGAALSIANAALAVGVIHFPVSPETQTWGALASVATGIGTVLSGVGDLRNE
jgi:hypothetical protein